MDLMGSDQAESLRRLLAPRVTRRIAVVGADPGAGATTVALGMANALAMPKAICRPGTFDKPCSQPSERSSGLCHSANNNARKMPLSAMLLTIETMPARTGVLVSWRE